MTKLRLREETKQSEQITCLAAETRALSLCSVVQGHRAGIGGQTWVDVCSVRRKGRSVLLDYYYRDSHSHLLDIKSDYPFCPCCHNRCLNSTLMAAGKAISMRAKGAQTVLATSPRALSRWSASGWAYLWPASLLHPPCCGQASPGYHSPRLMMPCHLSPMASSLGWASAQTAQVRPPRKHCGALGAGKLPVSC